MTRLRLALMLARTGGYRPWLVFTGSALGLVFLLAALALPHAHDAQTLREGMRSDPVPYTGSQPHLLWLWRSAPPIAGHDVIFASVAESAPGAPPPPGAAVTPKPGQILVSPALERALKGSDGRLLRLALPGTVVGVLEPGLVSRPDEMIAMVGYRDGLLEGVGTPVRSFTPAHDPWQARNGFDYRVGYTVVLLSVLIAVCLFLANVTRVSSARRDERLAALRLIGLTRPQAAWVIALEAGLAAVPGVVVGLAVTLAIRATAEGWPVASWPILMRDLTMPRWELALACLAMPAITFAGGLISARRAISSPLEARRRSSIDHPRAIILLLPLAGWIGLALAAVVGDRIVGGDHGKNLLVIASCAVAAAGLALSGPWIVTRTASVLARRSRSASPLLGARQLLSHPRTGFRAVAMLVMALFTSTLSFTYYGSQVAFSANASLGALAPAATPDRAGKLWIYSDPPVTRRELAAAAVVVRRVPGVVAAATTWPQLVVTTDGTPEASARVQGAARRLGPQWVSFDDDYRGGGTAFKDQVLHDSQSLLWLIDGLAAVSLVIAALDGIAARRRAFASLAALGVSPATLRRAVTIEVLLPFAVAALTAVAFGVLVGSTLVAITSRAAVTIPWDPIETSLIAAVVAALAAAGITALRVAAVVSPENLRTE